MMMHGLPVVANRTGGLAELIEEDEMRCRRLGAEARKRYEANFTMPLFEQKMIDFYQS